jgi:hypothetical protein
MTSKRDLCLATLFCALSALFAMVGRAERLVIIAHPDTGLVAEDVKFSQESEAWYLKPLTLLPPIFVSSSSAKDAPGDRAFVILIGKPKAQVVNRSHTMRPEGAGRDVRKEYRTILVYAATDFTLCYRQEAGGNLAELGKGVVWGEANQMNLSKDEDHDESVPYTISNETPEQLTCRAVRTAVQEIPRLISHVVAPNVLVTKTEPCASADEVLAWAKMIPETYRWKVDTKIISHSQRPMLSTHITNNFSRLKPKPQYSGTYEARFPPSRVVKNQDGSLTVEVHLWNRLPIRVAGELSRHFSEQEDKLQTAASRATPAWNEALRGAFNKKWELARDATFDLKPGEKKTASFHVAPEWAVDPAFVKNDTIVVHIRNLGLMAERAEKKALPQPKNKSRK